MDYYKNVLKKYAVFEGRARRAEYWYFFLFNFIISVGLSILDAVLSFNVREIGILSTLYSLFVLIPSLAVSVRRLHDVGKSGWMIFIILIPIVGAIWFLVLLLLDSEPGANEYGQNPKGVGGATTATPA